MCCEAHANRPARPTRAEIAALRRLRQQREDELLRAYRARMAEGMRQDTAWAAAVLAEEALLQWLQKRPLVIEQPSKAAPAEVAKELVLA